MEKFSAAERTSVSDPATTWDGIIADAPDAWLWHSRRMLEFTICAAESLHPVDRSFFVTEGKNIVGVVPLVVHDSVGERAPAREAGYHPGIRFLPWPAMKGAPSEAFEDFAFSELEQRARQTGASHITVQLIPPHDRGDEEARVMRVVEKFGYVRRHFESHVIFLEPDTLSQVRERYRRYHKKFAPLFNVSIVEKAAVTLELEETYAELHVKDIGRKVRSRESYTKQTDIARGGEGFYVVVQEKDQGRIVGMLLVSLYKNAAYDNSVAVDPDFADQYISHLMKWSAIEELLRRGTPTYELGPKAQADASEKERGISHFKEGWSRGKTRVIWEIEKELA